MPCHPTVMTLLYLMSVFYLVSLHSLRGCDGLGLSSALQAWYVILPSAVVLLALRYASQFPSVSDWLCETMGHDVARDLGLSRAPGPSGKAGDVFWTLIGDALVVAFLAAQPQRLARATRARADWHWRAGGMPLFLVWWHETVNTLGDAILQVVLFLAVDRRQSLIALGYLLFTVMFLMKPHLIQRLWMLPQLYAQCVCVLQTAIGLSTVRAWIHSFDATCPPYFCDVEGSAEVGSCECWLAWIGFDTLQAQTEPLSLFNLLSSDLLVVVASALVISRRRVGAAAGRGQPASGAVAEGGEARAEPRAPAADGATRRRLFAALRSLPLFVRYVLSSARLGFRVQGLGGLGVGFRV